MPEEIDGPNGQDGPEDLDQPPAFFPNVGPESGRGEDYGELVEVKIEGVFAAESGGAISRFVLLTDGDRRLPILIGPFEAQAISMPLDNQRPDRPLTHDLMRTVMDRLDAHLDRVVIDDLWSTIYYAKLYIRCGEEECEIDARPSDAVALAIRFDAPVFVADGILEQAMEG